tara:strand:- start:104 stop:391 length:288 start_codon:yes stop_codon:yes gene_type:complete
VTNALRKFKRKKSKHKKKVLDKSLKEVKRRLDSLGTNCKACGAPFSQIENPAAASQWMVYVIDNKPNLMCPDCCETVKETKKAWEEEVEDVENET